MIMKIELTYRLKNGKIETYTFASVGRANRVVKGLGPENILKVDGEEMTAEQVTDRFEALMAVQAVKVGYVPPAPKTQRESMVADGGLLALAEKQLGVEIDHMLDDSGMHWVETTIAGQKVEASAKTDRGAVLQLIKEAERVKNRVAATALGI
jgi:hypothetical protein